jgi:hypothetical protein
VKALGGPHLLYSLQHSHGLPSWRNVCHHVKVPKLMPSIGVPTSNKISYNIASFYDPSVKLHAKATQTGLLPGNVAMFDGIDLDTRC